MDLGLFWDLLNQQYRNRRALVEKVILDPYQPPPDLPKGPEDAWDDTGNNAFHG